MSFRPSQVPSQVPLRTPLKIGELNNTEFLTPDECFPGFGALGSAISRNTVR